MNVSRLKEKCYCVFPLRALPLRPVTLLILPRIRRVHRKAAREHQTASGYFIISFSLIFSVKYQLSSHCYIWVLYPLFFSSSVLLPSTLPASFISLIFSPVSKSCFRVNEWPVAKKGLGLNHCFCPSALSHPRVRKAQCCHLVVKFVTAPLRLSDL